MLADSLDPSDRVVLEATGNALAIARILAPGCAEVLLAHPKRLRAISHAKVKTDKFDARVLAELLAANLIPAVWIPDEQTRRLRRQISRRRALVKRCTALKNEISAVLIRNLKRRPEMTDLFGRSGRDWLDRLELPLDERETVDACLRQLDFMTGELSAIDTQIAGAVIHSEQMRRLMTIPGVDATTAATVIAAIGDVSRFPTSRHLVGYLGLHPKVRQSGSSPARHGRTSKEGPAAARHVLVEAAWITTRSPGPLRAFGQRVAARRGKHIAAVAVARKLATLAWHMLTHEQDYAFQRPTLTRRKLRRLELMTGAPRVKPGPNHIPMRKTGAAQLEWQIAEQAEIAYRRMMADWQATGPREGAGATKERASDKPSKGTAAPQATSS